MIVNKMCTGKEAVDIFQIIPILKQDRFEKYQRSAKDSPRV